MKNQALEYATRGWAVVALSGKLPCSTETTFKHATTDASLINSWWGRWPNANVGVAPAKSGLIVLDVDPKNGGDKSLAELVEIHGPLTTLQVRTGSGGSHFYFKAPSFEVRNKISKLADGLDVISATGHVVAPPSIHPDTGQAYIWANTADVEELPTWLAEALKGMDGDTDHSFAPLDVPMPPQTGEIYSRLQPPTRKFLKEGAEAGKRHDELYKAARNWHQEMGSEESFISVVTPIITQWGNTMEPMRHIRDAFSKPPELPPSTDKYAGLRKVLDESTLIRNIEATDDYALFNPATGRHRKIDIDAIKQVLGPDIYKEYIRDKALLAQFKYEPHTAAAIALDDENIHIYNAYQPPAWKAALHFKGEAIKPEPLPALYQEFFNHLTGGDEKSVDYLLNWLALSLQGRNLTILTAIGEQGIGKGVLAEIMRELHGATNFVKVRDTIFKNHFNAPLKNRTLVYVDEADLKTKESHDRIKDVVNDTIEIEEKGRDSTNVTNHASYYLSSNTMEAVNQEAGDRRFSIIELTSTPLKETPLMSRVKELLSSENVHKLGRHLFTRPITFDAFSPFKSLRAEAVKEASLSDWEHYFISDWVVGNAGRDVSLEEAQDVIAANCNLRGAPGRRKFIALEKLYPEKFHVYQDTKNLGKRRIKVAGVRAISTPHRALNELATGVSTTFAHS